MNPYIQKEFHKAVEQSTEYFSKDYARLKVLEEQFNKITMLLNIASERNLLERTTEVTVYLSDKAIKSYSSIAEALRASIWKTKP